MRVTDEPERTVYPPDDYREAVLRVVEHNGLRRRAAGDRSSAELQPSSRVGVDVRRDHNLAFVRVEEPGADLQDLVSSRLRDLCLHGVDCVLPLSHTATPRAGSGLGDLGLFFGGIIPEAHSGPVGGDVLWLQYLNDVEVEASDVQTASDFGRELVESIFLQKRAAER